MDDVLEKLTMKSYTTLTGQCIPQIYRFPIINIRRSKNSASKLYLHVPDFISAKSPLGIQIPTKSVRIRSYCGNEEVSSSGNPFSNVLANLSSLYLGCSLHFTFLSAKTLLKILQHTPNLKALSLSHITFKVLEDDINSILTPLSHLAYIRCRRLWLESSYKEFSLFEWIVSPYKNQILSLSSDFIDEFPRVSMVFPKLEMWIISLTWTKLPMEMEILCPCLRRLSLQGWWLEGRHGPIWSQLIDVVANFSPALVDLNFTLRILNETPMALNEIWNSGNSFESCGFPLVKTFRTANSNGLDKVLHLRYILAKFPNLKTLIIYSISGMKNPEPEKQAAKTLVENEQYWKICPLLEKIVLGLKEWGLGTDCEFVEWDCKLLRA